MKTYVDAIGGVVVTATSPDRGVTVRLGAAKTTVELDRGALSRHDEASLSVQIGTALTRALAGGAKAVGLLTARGEADDPRPVGEPRRPWRDRIVAELATLDTTADSGPVTVRILGGRTAEAVLRPRTLGYVDARQLTHHLNAAVAAAMSAQAAPAYDICMRALDLDTSSTVKGNPRGNQQ